MPVLLCRHPCPGCGLAHDLCHVGPRTYSLTGTYAFTCPTTQKRVHFRPFIPGTVVGDSPAGAVEIRRLDSDP
jgi:hypothetical protein